jgi:zinc protease
MTLFRKSLVGCFSILATGNIVFAGKSSSTITTEPNISSSVSVLVNDSLRIDPDLFMGQLANGLRYYVKVNKFPQKRAELRLAVNAGSIQEDEDQRGFAHFLEHMAFNGTARFPKHALINFVEESGMQFGADLNAYTSFDETVYMLTIPTDDPKTLYTGMQVLEDWASGSITIDSGEVLAERGVVLGEWRSRLMDSISRNWQDHLYSILFDGSLYYSRMPIGDPKLLETALPAPIKRFYKDWYRPDLMAVIVVGDFDGPQMVRYIQDHFGKIPAVKRPRPRVPVTISTPQEPVVDIHRGRIGNPQVTILWKTPPVPTSVEDALRHRIIERLLLTEVNNKFLSIREQHRRPFFEAHLARKSIVRGRGDEYQLDVTAVVDSLQGGLAAALTELERIAQYGIPQATLERRKAALLRQFESGVDAQNADPSETFARIYVHHFLTNEGVLLNSQQELLLAKQILSTITSNTIAQAAQFWRQSQNFTILYRIPLFAQFAPPTRERLLALFDSVANQPVAEDNSPIITASSELLEKSPVPGRIVEEKRHVKADITEWILSNGARVLYKPTQFNPDELFIHAVSLGGTSLLPDSLALSPGRLVGMMMTAAGGVGKSDRGLLEQQLNEKVLREFEVSLTYTNEAIRLGGSPRDIETLFQLLYLQFTAPKMDTAAIAAWKRYGYVTLTQSTNDQIASTLSRGNPRLAPPDFALVDLVDLQQAMTIYRDRFGDAGDFTFTIVGAASREVVRPLVERYIASLPSLHRKERERPVDLNLTPWNSIVRGVQRVQPVQRATTTMVFDGRFSESVEDNLSERRKFSALTIVLNRRLRNVLREQLGGTYGVAVAPMLYANPREHFQIRINFDAAPDRVYALEDVLMANLDSLRQFGATPEELKIVTKILERRRERSLQSNRYWLTTLQEYERLGIPFDRIGDSSTMSLTPEDIRAAAQKYLPENAYIHFTALPRDSVPVVRSP